LPFFTHIVPPASFVLLYAEDIFNRIKIFHPY